MIIKPEPGVYLIFCLGSQKVYVGQSTSVKRRITDHQGKLKSNRHKNLHLQNAYNKYGVDMFVFRPLEYPEDTSPENLTLREQYWIDFYNSMDKEKGFNMKEAGLGGQPNEETRQKMAEAAKGKKKSPESIAKTVSGNTGKKRSPEQLERIREGIALKRKSVLSDAGREKMREAQLGRQQSEEEKKKRKDSMAEYFKSRTPEQIEERREISRRSWAKRKATNPDF
jgi:group I intron endonuclease